MKKNDLPVSLGSEFSMKELMLSFEAAWLLLMSGSLGIFST